MSKGNRSLAAKVAKNGSLYHGGTLDGEYYRSQYQQGYEAWSDGVKPSKSWHPHKLQGWNKAFQADVKFLEQLKQRYKEKGITPNPDIVDRVVNRLKLVA